MCKNKTDLLRLRKALNTRSILKTLPPLRDVRPMNIKINKGN